MNLCVILLIGLSFYLPSREFSGAEQCGAYICHTIWRWCFGKK